jgi:hypothetical protein
MRMSSQYVTEVIDRGQTCQKCVVKSIITCFVQMGSTPKMTFNCDMEGVQYSHELILGQYNSLPDSTTGSTEDND